MDEFFLPTHGGFCGFWRLVLALITTFFSSVGTQAARVHGCQLGLSNHEVPGNWASLLSFTRHGAVGSSHPGVVSGA